MIDRSGEAVSLPPAGCANHKLALAKAPDPFHPKDFETLRRNNVMTSNPLPLILDPVLTIGLPVYNSGPTVIASIRSILSQTWHGTREILIVDDGSDTKTREILIDLEKSEPSVRLLAHEKNLGRPFARNTILENARGRYLTWIDADDEWYPEKLETQFRQLYAVNGDENRCICLSAYDWQWEGGGLVRIKFPELRGNPLAGILNGNIGCYLWTMLATTETFRSVGKFDTNLPRLQDLEFLIRYASTGGQFTTTSPEQPLCIYRKSDINRSGKSVEVSVRHIWKKHQLAFSAFGSRFERYAKQDHLTLVARHYQNNGQRLRAILPVLESLFMAPKRALKRIGK